ncbi:DUF3833 family protein [Aurantimonas endophytica]|uniref:DUF3833 family protein n=1 Tax=Aurantimonas endophytica TaxID=1522175 RepID=A0A7W6HEK2_9HYPH|nr:hypothetical protein [Aurantimonas endophytica]MCO6404367.1 DUF3833 family protein [Aurantimonas endophytica]
MTGRLSRRFTSPRRGRLAAALVLAWPLAGCGQAPAPVADGFSLADFFDGRSVSEGTVRTALLLDEPFTASFEGRRAADRLRLDERFVFEDGARLQRWDLSRSRAGVYTGTVATEDGDGTLSAPVPVAGWATVDGAVLAYDGYAPGGADTLLHFRHVMSRNGDGTLANRVTISKFGISIATSKVTFARSEAALAPG